MNPIYIVGIVLATVLLVLFLTAGAVALFFLIRWLRELTTALKTIATTLAVFKDAEPVETAKAIRTVSQQVPQLAQQFGSLRQIVEQLVRYAMQAPEADRIINGGGGPAPAAGGGEPGKMYAPPSDDELADREERANLARMGMETRDNRAPDVGEVEGSSASV